MLTALWYVEGDFDEIVFIDDANRMWRTTFDVVKDLVSVALDGTKEGYKTRSVLYDPNEWRIN